MSRELTNTRLIPVAPALIFQAFQKPEILARWWGPTGFTNTFQAFEFQPGGRWRCDMLGPDGTRYPNEWVFREISAHQIVIRHVEPVHAFTLTVTLDPVEEGDADPASAGSDSHTPRTQTFLTWHMAFDSAGECEKVRPYAPACNEQNLDRLEAAIAPWTAGDRELVITRIIDAPAARLYQAWAMPSLITRWFTPPPWETSRAELDVRPGGSNLIVMRGPDGAEMPNRGVYLEVVENRRLVITDAYERAWVPSAKPFLTLIITFEELGENRTRYTVRACHWTVADREAHEAMGFYQGWSITTDQLARLHQ